MGLKEKKACIVIPLCDWIIRVSVNWPLSHLHEEETINTNRRWNRLPRRALLMLCRDQRRTRTDDFAFDC